MIWRMVADFEAEHIVDDRSCRSRSASREAVGCRLAVPDAACARSSAERVEIGGKMAAHAVGADQHQRADRFARRFEVSAGDSSTPSAWALDGDLPPIRRSAASGPVAGERTHQLAIDRGRPVLTFPGRSVRLGDDVFLALLQICEKSAPIRCDGAGIFLKA